METNTLHKTLNILLQLVLMDLKKKYLGTSLGIFWSFISPVITISIIYFVFRYGLKTQVVNGVDFLPWLIAGLLAWFYISESISTSCWAIIENSHLITKLKFPVKLIPPVKAMSPLLPHFLLLSFFAFYLILTQDKVHYSSWPQVFYYILCSTTFMISISYFTSSVMVFIRDLANIISALLQIFYWLTPIFWNLEILPEKFINLIRFNPFFYIVSGYRDSFFGGRFFWERPTETATFWSISFITLLIGRYIYIKTRPQFSDVL